MLTSTTFLRPVNAIPADAQSATTVNGTGFSRLGFDSAVVILSCGDLGASATLDVKIQESDVLGSGYVDVTGAAFTQKTQAGTNHSDLIFAGHLDLRPRKKFLRAVGTVGVAASEYAVVVGLYNALRKEDVTAGQTGSEANAQGTYDFTV